jgi:hypothetical protein
MPEDGRRSIAFPGQGLTISLMDEYGALIGTRQRNGRMTR